MDGSVVDRERQVSGVERVVALPDRRETDRPHPGNLAFGVGVVVPGQTEVGVEGLDEAGDVVDAGVGPVGDEVGGSLVGEEDVHVRERLGPFDVLVGEVAPPVAREFVAGLLVAGRGEVAREPGDAEARDVGDGTREEGRVLDPRGRFAGAEGLDHVEVLVVPGDEPGRDRERVVSQVAHLQGHVGIGVRVGREQCLAPAGVVGVGVPQDEHRFASPAPGIVVGIAHRRVARAGPSVKRSRAKRYRVMHEVPTRRRFLRATAGAGLVGLAGCGSPEESGRDHRTVRVPADQPSIQAGVEAASAGDLVLIAPGVYEEAVAVTTPAVTLRGRDRNAVVLDGGYERSDGVDVEADGVAVENLTARHYTETGVYWDDVEGFRGSYLTAHTNGGYGIYASRSRDGRFERCYASGHADAGFYLGRNHPFETVVTNVVAERNALGYSGTSAGGDLTIRDSVWLDNGAGIVPHTLDRADPPQRDTRVVDNVVLRNDNAEVPVRAHTYPAFGTGIFVWGGSENVVEGNLVADHEHCGVAVHHNVVPPSDNLIRGNAVRDSGLADLALGVPSGSGTRFRRNGYETSLPAGIEGGEATGSERVASVYEAQERRAERRAFPQNDWRESAPPAPQPTMPDPAVAPRPAGKNATVGIGRSGE